MARPTALAFAVAITAAFAALAACEDSSSSSSSSSGDIDSGTFDGATSSSSSTSSSSGGEDAPSADAPTDAPAPSNEPAVGVVNLRGTAIDFCIKKPGEAAFTGPVFQTQGGIPNNAASVKYPIPVETQVMFVPAGNTCANQIFTPGAVTSAGTPRVTIVVRGAPVDDARIVFWRPQSHVAGKEVIYLGPVGRDGRFAVGAGNPIELMRDQPTALDPNLVGQLELYANANPTFTRAMKTGSGVLLAVETATDILLCDELAPPNGHLLQCGATVRAP